MNNKLYKWLAVTLLLSVSVFCFLYLTKTEKNISGQADATDVIKDDTIVDTPVEPPEKPVFYNTLPRSALTFQDYIVQNVGGTDSDVLKSVHSINNNTILFFDSSSNGYDVRTEKASVIAAVLDKNLSLLKTVTLSGQSDEKFAAIKQTSKGFVVVTLAETYSTVYQLNFELMITGKLTLEKANAYTLYASDNLYLIAEKDDCLQIKVLNSSLEVLKTATAYMDYAKIVSIFPEDKTLNIFVNCNNGYSLIRYTEDGGIKSVNEIDGYKLLSVLPYSENGSLKFAGLKKNDDGINIFLANKDFGILSEVTTEYKDGAELFISDGNFSVYGNKSNEATLSVYCRHLDKIIEKDAPVFSNITYRNYVNDNITVVGYVENTLTIYNFNDLEFSKVDTFFGFNGYCRVLYDGTFVFTSAHKSTIYQNNFGNYDIFLIKNSAD